VVQVLGLDCYGSINEKVENERRVESKYTTSRNNKENQLYLILFTHNNTLLL